MCGDTESVFKNIFRSLIMSTAMSPFRLHKRYPSGYFVQLLGVVRASKGILHTTYRSACLAERIPLGRLRAREKLSCIQPFILYKSYNSSVLVAIVI